VRLRPGVRARTIGGKGLTLDTWDEAMGFFTRIDARLGAIAISYLGTSEKVAQLTNTDWYDETLDRFQNKLRMKEVGGSAFQYQIFLHENSILALAKAIEDTAIELRRFTKFKFDSVREHHGARYVKEMQTIRALANVIKHNLSTIQRSTSESAKFLVDECGVQDNVTLDGLILSGSGLFSVVEYIPKVFLGLLDVVEKATGIRHQLLDLNFNEAFNEIYEHLIPDVLGMRRPNKALQGDAQQAARA
jgi:hypothetical protein